MLRKVAEDVYLIRIPRPAPAANCYLIRGEEPALIDAGHASAASWELLRKEIERAGVDPADLAAVIYTHPHRDHMGGGEAPWLRGGRAEGIIFHAALERLAGGERFFRMLRAEREERARYILPAGGFHSFGPEHLERFLAAAGRPWRVSIKRGVRDGEELVLGGLRLRVVHTPGHQKDHICLFDPARSVVFCGDALLHGIVSALDDLGEYEESLVRIEHLEPALALPGHGALIEDVPAEIGRLRQMIREEEEKVLQTLDDGDKSLPAILAACLRRVPAEYGLYQSRAAQYLAILKWMMKKGLVREVRKGGRRSFALNR